MGKTIKRTIFVPVGTSLLQEARLKKIFPYRGDQIESNIQSFRNRILKNAENNIKVLNRVNWTNWRNCITGDTPADFFNEYLKVNPSEEINRREQGRLRIKDPDKLSAELASLYLFFNEMKGKSEKFIKGKSFNQKNEIILLASDTNKGLYCACFLADYLKNKDLFNDNIDEVVVERISKLSSDDEHNFDQEGINNLVEQTTELIKQRQNGRALYLNITGGYKGVLPYLAILGLAFGEMDVFYLYELSPQILWLPKMPVGFDFFTWRDYRVFMRSIPHIKGLEEEDLNALVPVIMKTLFKKENDRFVFNVLGKVLYDQYEEERGKAISEHGRGYLLTNKINCPQNRQALRDCIDRWQYLWIGDLIPETVEHARGHTQRDLELLSQIIYPILNREENFFGDDIKTDNTLLVLLASIWLHDLGHSGCYLECKNIGGSLQDGEEIQLDIKGFPSLVRDIHHLLGWYLIGKEKDKLFASRSKSKWLRNETIFEDNLINAIRVACLYHRGKMPVEESHDSFKRLGIEITQPVQELNNKSVNLPLVCALLRMADEGEVQQERIICDEYINMRELQNRREIEILTAEEETYRRIILEMKPDLPDCLQFAIDVADKYFKQKPENEFTLNCEYLSITSMSKSDKKYKDLEYLRDNNLEKYSDVYFDYLVEACAKKFFEEDNLERLDDRQLQRFIRSWLSIINQIIFKKRQPDHFLKHKGIKAIMYLLDLDKKENNGFETNYCFKVLAIHNEGNNKKEKEMYIRNAEEVVLKDIHNEYLKIKNILASNRIFFHSYYRMEEGSEDMIPVEFDDEG